ncbi:galactose mutarotase [Paraflavitalea soli]|uniref:Aldose 1-epimerase n=1 Tax=Paraflavitalea soli TaxID=2315862 RepID=A0A3B7MVP0_9BACT|nr:aldose epimerase family protein [Paraflavitalea soli]AXY78007.1 galactose mutarotase [Paraflavitalea soli]
MHLARSLLLKATISSYRDEANETIQHILLTNGDTIVGLTNIGCTITAIYTSGRDNIKKNIVAGFDNLELYKVNKHYFGCVVGRYANRIANGTFMLGSERYQVSVNDRPNHLHGGWKGFSHKIWKLEEVIENGQECGVVFSYYSADGEEGYPGNLSVSVKYVLDKNNRLGIFYKAVTDKSTPINLTNHSYFNLTGFEVPTVLEHYLQVNAEQYTKKSANNTSDGNIATVADTALDFRTSRQIGHGIANFPKDMGYDHNLILNQPETKGLIKAAVLHEVASGRVLTVYTDRPAIQVYTANYWDGSMKGGQGQFYQQHGGVALETHAYPDSVNHAHFPNTILHPGEEYNAATVFEFGVAG